ncbi:hypothetical protein O0I10_000217 [Lichtheimia ornata]|uniref:Protein BIG1 n=1 Tax=Lichtheimia ornata TaxID=688661 RepID=A0AAD7Y589_9FUNG|nr:uncharacterized protein O0I10_000217 [Lichtheimia ornata]KAJ8663942.1 hypothetical protein O0I10_000217 [Lichtheimia ornata]
MRLSKVTSLVSLAFVGAAPLQDLSTTSIDVTGVPANVKGDEHLYVTVTRTDDLVDDDGSLLAERVMAVQVSFDVIENQLHCNGVPVDVGVSNVQVEAAVAPNPEKLMIASEEEAAILEDTFDIGLANVEVHATLLDEIKLDDGTTFRRMAIEERITEINGEQVVQTNAGQQILDVFDNGKVERWAVDPLTGFLLPGPAMVAEEENADQTQEKQQHDDMSSEPHNIAQPPPNMIPEHAGQKGCASALVDPMVTWWNEQSTAVRGMITGGVCAFFLAIAMVIRQIMVSAHDEYEPIALSDKEDEQVWSTTEKKDEEKQPFLS